MTNTKHFIICSAVAFSGEFPLQLIVLIDIIIVFDIVE